MVLSIPAVISFVMLSLFLSPSIHPPMTSMVSGIASPWPMFHQNPQHTGQSSFVGSSTPTLKWKFKTIAPIVSSPAVTFGTIYVGGEDGNLYALNRQGVLKWEFTTGGPIESSPAVGSQGTVYVGSNDGYLYAINRDGTLAWRIKVSPFDCMCEQNFTPTIASDGTIYVGTDQFLYSIRPNGTLNWNLTTFSGGGIHDSPAVSVDRTIYIGVDDPNLEAVYPNGTMKWISVTRPFFSSSPAIAKDGTIYIADGILYAFNPDGRVRWNFTGPANSPSIGSNGTIYDGGYSGLYAIRPNGTLLWIFPKEILSSSAIGADGVVYVTSVDGNLYAVNPDGTLKWAFNGDFQPTGFYGTSYSPALGPDGTIYVGSTDGNLYAIG